MTKGSSINGKNTVKGGNLEHRKKKRTYKAKMWADALDDFSMLECSK